MPDTLSANLRTAIADVFDVAVTQFRQGGPDAARALRQIRLMAQPAQDLLAAAAGAASDSEPAHAADVEPATTETNGFGSVAQSAENYGNRVINEVLALGRAYVAGQAKSKLSDVLDAYYAAKTQNETEIVEVLQETLAVDYGVKVGVGPQVETLPAPPARAPSELK